MYDKKEYKRTDTEHGDQIYSLFQSEDIVFGSYKGGSTRFGTLIGTLDKFLNLDFIYQELTQDNKMLTGKGFIQPLTKDPNVLNLYRTSSLRSNKKSRFLLFPI